jgi:hypothetical protein
MQIEVLLENEMLYSLYDVPFFIIRKPHFWYMELQDNWVSLSSGTWFENFVVDWKVKVERLTGLHSLDLASLDMCSCVHPNSLVRSFVRYRVLPWHGNCPNAIYARFSENKQHAMHLVLLTGGNETSSWGLCSDRRRTYGTFTVRNVKNWVSCKG